MSPSIFLIGFGVAAIFILSLVFTPYLVTVLLLFIAGLILMFDYENPQRASLYGLGVLLVLMFMFMQNEMNLLAIPVVILFLIYLFFQLKKRNFKILSFVMPVILVASAFSLMASFVFDNVLKPHQQERINVWLRPEKCDPRGSLYNIIQSKMAIGSGGLAGKGFLKGEMTKLNYVPEQSTDFIFTSIGEEQGFIGSVGIIILFTILLLRCFVIAERANLEFIRNYGYAVGGIFLVHFVFNIGMTMGLLPVVGIPLPFLSKGGSSLIAFTIMIAVLIKMDMARFRSN